MSLPKVASIVIAEKKNGIDISDASDYKYLNL